MNGLLDTALEIAHEQDALMVQLRSALELGDQVRAIAVARELCGLNREEESHRAN